MGEQHTTLTLAEARGRRERVWRDVPEVSVNEVEHDARTFFSLVPLLHELLPSRDRAREFGTALGIAGADKESKKNLVFRIARTKEFGADQQARLLAVLPHLDEEETQEFVRRAAVLATTELDLVDRELRGTLSDEDFLHLNSQPEDLWNLGYLPDDLSERRLREVARACVLAAYGASADERYDRLLDVICDKRWASSFTLVRWTWWERPDAQTSLPSSRFTFVEIPDSPEYRAVLAQGHEVAEAAHLGAPGRKRGLTNLLAFLYADRKADFHELARRLGFVPPQRNTRVEAVAEQIVRSRNLGQNKEEKLQRIVAEMDRPTVMRLVAIYAARVETPLEAFRRSFKMENTLVFSPWGSEWQPSPGALERLGGRVALLASELVAADHASDPAEALRDVVTSRAWGNCFRWVRWPHANALAQPDDGIEETESDAPAGLPESVDDVVDDVDEALVASDDDDEVGDQTGWKYQTDYEAGPGVSLPIGLTPSDDRPLPHQEQALERLRSWWRSDEPHGVLCLPTGAGKTYVATTFLLDEVGAGRSVLWVTHRTELMNQALSSVLRLGHRCARKFRVARFGRKGARGEEPSEVVVGMVTSLVRGLDDLNELSERFDLVVVDECHHAVATTWAQVLKSVTRKGARVLGLTATPTRTDRRERDRLWKLFGHTIHVARPLELIQQKVLARPVLYPVETAYKVHPRAEDVRYARRFKDLSKRLVSEIAADDERNRLVVRTFVEHQAMWGKTVLYAGTRQQGKLLLRLLQGMDVSAAYVDGESSAADREDAIKRFKVPDGIQALVNVDLFTEGVDLPGAQSVFIARPTRSQILFQQMVGRGLRGTPFQGTETCNIVTFHDHLAGLFDEALANSGRWEVEALAALGFDQGTLAAPAGSGVQPEQVHVVRAQLGDLERATQLRIREQATNLRSWMSARDCPAQGAPQFTESQLVGWWELTEAQLFLPVFAHDRAGIAAIMAGLAAQLLEGTSRIRSAEDLGLTPRSSLAVFVDDVLGSHQAPGWNECSSIAQVPVTPLSAAAPATPPIVDVIRASGPGFEATDAPSLQLDWLAAARRRIAGELAMVTLGTDAGVVQLSSSQHVAVRAFWDQHSANLAGLTPEMVGRMLGALRSVSALPPVLEADLERLVMHAAARGELPAPAPDRAPSLPEVWQSVKHLTARERTAAIIEIQRAFFDASMPVDEFTHLVIDAVLC